MMLLLFHTDRAKAIKLLYQSLIYNNHYQRNHFQSLILQRSSITSYSSTVIVPLSSASRLLLRSTQTLSFREIAYRHHMDNKQLYCTSSASSANTPHLNNPSTEAVVNKCLQTQQQQSHTLFDKPLLEQSSQVRPLSSTTSSYTDSGSQSEKPFLPRKALVLKKFSRLEYERLCNPGLREESLAQKLSQRGSAYETLRHHDEIQRSCLKQIESVLKANKIEYQTVDRFGYTDEKVEWADVIVTSGGDGTFLMAASKVPTRDKPVIGINSDPTKSVGHLCLPSQYTNHFDRVIDSLKTGQFQWRFRQRLRVTLTGDAALETPRALDDIRYNIRGQYHDQEDSHEHHGALPIISGNATTTVQNFEGTSMKVKQLKERALNEVFVGELLSARVSYYELSVDNNKPLKFKSSGLTVCTGTGSTSWYFNINKITEQQAESISKIINNVTKSQKIDTDDRSLIEDITKQFNEKLTFSPTEPIMAYSIRDPVGYTTLATGYSHRGNAKRIEIKSRMQNACLVLDGCQFYPFDNGSFALIETYDEDALRTLNLPASQ